MQLRIGNLRLSGNLMLAPIAGYTNLPFRLVVRELGGVGLAFTDLVNPRGLLRGTRKSLELARTCPADTPVGLQLYGSDAGDLVRAAQAAQASGADLVDLNMGCPAEKIVRRGAGAALLRDPQRAVELVHRLVRAVEIPVTAKIRLGWDDAKIVAPQLAAALERVGVSAVTVHGRTAVQKFAGEVRLDELARVVDAVHDIPVIGNGDVRSPGDATRMIRRTGCAGVMIGRAALSDPWIFRDAHALLAGREAPHPPSRDQRIDLMVRHFRLSVEYLGERRACLEFRQRISWYAKRLRPCADLQTALRNLNSAQQFHWAIDEFRRCQPDPAIRAGSASDRCRRPIRRLTQMHADELWVPHALRAWGTNQIDTA